MRSAVATAAKNLLVATNAMKISSKVESSCSICHFSPLLSSARIELNGVKQRSFPAFHAGYGPAQATNRICDWPISRPAQVQSGVGTPELRHRARLDPRKNPPPLTHEEIAALVKAAFEDPAGLAAEPRLAGRNVPEPSDLDFTWYFLFKPAIHRDEF
jgi:hypothetical protein